MALSPRRHLRWIAAAVFVLGGPFMGLVTFRLADRLEHERASALCVEYFSERAAALTRELHEITDELQHLRSLFESLGRVSRAQFHQFTAEIPARHPAIVAMEWVPRVAGRDRERHELEARLDGLAGYRISVPAQGGGMRPAPAKDVYYPVYFAEPAGRNHRTLGFDISSEDSRSAALMWASLTREPAVSAPIDLMPDPEPSKGILVLLPVFQSAAADPPAKPAPPDGLVLLVVRAREVFARMLGSGGGARNMDFELLHEPPGSRPVVLGETGSDIRRRSYSDWVFAESISIGGQRWRLSGRPSLEFVTRHLTWEPTVLGIGVFFLWELLGGFALAVVRQARDAAFRRQTRIVETALRSLNEGVVVADGEGQLLFSNRAAERMIGPGPRDVPVPDWAGTWGCLDPDTQAPVPVDRLPLAKAIGGVESQAEVIVRDGASRESAWLTISGTPLRDERGGFEGAVITLRDITQARMSQVQLQLLSNAVEQTADAILITDREGVIEYVNPAFESTTGYSRAEAIRQTPRILKSGQVPQEFYRELWTTISAGEVFRGMPINRRKNGECYQAEQTITPIRNAEGRIVHFVSVIKDVTDRIRAQHQEIELRYAAEVQQKFYPRQSPRIPGLDIAGATVPALANCGDYYDYLEDGDGRINVVIADVSGHGLGPALIMAETRGYLRAFSASCGDPGDVLDRVNQALCGDLDENRFVAIVIARVDVATRRVVYANAGHTAAYHLGRSGRVKAVLDSTGPPLGILANRHYASRDGACLEDGDVLVFLTDGVTETEDTAGRELGAEAALDVVRGHSAEPASEIIGHLQQATRQFAQGATQEDDVTVVICKVRGES